MRCPAWHHDYGLIFALVEAGAGGNRDSKGMPE